MGFFTRILAAESLPIDASRKVAEAQQRAARRAPTAGSDRNPLDRIPGDLFLPTVVKSGCSGIGVSQQILHVLQRNSVEQEIGCSRHTERVRRELAGKPSVA
jgi:hypothetical protein